MLIDFEEYDWSAPNSTIAGFENLSTHPCLEFPQRIIGLLQDFSESLGLYISVRDSFSARLFGGWIAARVEQMNAGLPAENQSFSLAFSLSKIPEEEENKEYALSLFRPLGEKFLTKSVYWRQTSMWLTIPIIDEPRFSSVFSASLAEPGFFDFDNLLHLVMIVKDAGDSFEEVLQTYLPHIDRWTILDTGSTDGTIETARRVLGSKRGNLYQEPFQDFATSRNRCLELAGKSCVFHVMMDDTYKMSGEWRATLHMLRTDQTADSFSFYIVDGDIKYISNRILKPTRGLKYLYKIHEVIQENYNFILPAERLFVEDAHTPYMAERTRERNYRDIAVLEQCIAEDPKEPRFIYYLAQTYRVLGENEKALREYIHRVHFPVAGFYKERADACFEVIKIGLFESLLPLEEVEYYVKLAEKIDPTRPEPIYFLGIYFNEKKEHARAFELLKKVMERGYPRDAQFNTNPSFYNRFTPLNLLPLCFQFKDWELGIRAAQVFLENNPPLQTVVSWKKIFEMIQSVPAPNQVSVQHFERPIVCIVADGNWTQWSGASIASEGLGGSETFVVEIARNIENAFKVVVFCNTARAIEHDGVEYRPIGECFCFFREFVIHTCIVSRFSEYVFAAAQGNVEHIYAIAHDLEFSTNFFPQCNQFKGILGLSDSHCERLRRQFPSIPVEAFGYGIHPAFLEAEKVQDDSSVRFIYSSAPNRGLLQLLRMWPRIQSATGKDARLSVCSDLDNTWITSFYKRELAEIRELLMQNGVSFRGWVSKSELLQEWARADVWFYPCTFEETFCLTALEAAATRTLAITNDLGSLSEVVGERGIIVPGDPQTEEWQERAMEALVGVLQNKGKQNYLIAANYEWARKRTWKARADEFVQKYVRSDTFLEYRNMYNWTNDILPGSLELVAQLMKRVPQDGHILEVGTFAGTSVIGFLGQLGANARAHVIDSWKDYLEEGSVLHCESNKIFDSFVKNVLLSKVEERVTVFVGGSIQGLLSLIKKEKKFDFIHIDASHFPEDCYTDAMLAWRVLKPGGILLFDDYEFHGKESRRVVDKMVDKVGAKILFAGINRLACQREEA
jgi:predicted O-methyltransferase YrrM/tetratricopeptide (TPR) repeat protein